MLIASYYVLWYFYRETNQCIRDMKEVHDDEQGNNNDRNN